MPRLTTQRRKNYPIQSRSEATQKPLLQKSKQRAFERRKAIRPPIRSIRRIFCIQRNARTLSKKSEGREKGKAKTGCFQHTLPIERSRSSLTVFEEFSKIWVKLFQESFLIQRFESSYSESEVMRQTRFANETGLTAGFPRTNNTIHWCDCRRDRCPPH